MKKIILTIAILGSTLALSAQTKADTTKKPKPPVVQPKTYPGIPNMTPVTITLTLPAYLLGDFGIVEQVGSNNLDYSDRITAKQATIYKANHKTVIDSLTSKWQQYVDKDMKRWASDTGKVVKTKK